MRQANLLTLCLLTPLIWLSGCASQTAEPAEESDALLTVAKQHEVTLVPLQEQSVYQVLHLNGRIGVPPENEYVVSSLFEGSVQSLHLLPGAQVRKGELLLEIQDEQILLAQQRFSEAAAAREFQQAEYQRYTSLFQEQIISRKQFQQSEQAYKASESAYLSALSTLNLMGIDPDAVLAGVFTPRLKIVAPFAGVVSEINVTQGAYVSSNTPLMRVTKTDHLHVEFPVYEADIAHIYEGQSVRIARPNSTAYTLPGTVHLIGRTVEKETRSIPVHADFVRAEDQQLWVPGGFVQLKVLLDESSAMSLPESALTELESAHYALRLVSETAEAYRFEKVFVRPGKRGDGVVEVLNFKDFKPEDRFVKQGVFELISE
ncbi:MAG: hypothetical protein RLZZ242_545 [Bacteroidota bacterium]|jgi:cobalt-zinc-cadmium efflux system membrane fusion protein